MPTNKPRKYLYLYVLQGDYGYGHGWEDIAAEDKHGGYERTDVGGKVKLRGPWDRIRETRKEYRENEGGTYRIVERREVNPDYTPAAR